MMYIERPKAPDFMTEKQNTPWGLIENQEKWSRLFAEKLAKGASDISPWAKHEKEYTNRKLIPILKEMTKNHCSFCDAYPLSTDGESIEHFKPKTKYPLLSHIWENLFYACFKCQEYKHDKFDDLLLKPDDTNYTFEDYFMLDRQGENIFIIPLPANSEEQKLRASKTIEYYGLNRYDRPHVRWKELVKWEKYKSDSDFDINDFRYRYLFL